MNTTRFFDLDKKLLIKVAAGVVLLVVALIFYLVKESIAEQDLTYSKIPEIHDESIITTTDPAITEDSAQKITMIVVDISGAVISPSVVVLPEGSRVYEAIEKAGGLSKEADTTILNQAEMLTDGQKVYIPTKQEIERISSQDNFVNIIPSTINSGMNSGRSELININTATTEILQQLSGIGPATADKIINYRNENGKFNRIEDIKNVSGIGEKTYDRFKDKITI
jgi:competence protein ComEA